MIGLNLKEKHKANLVPERRCIATGASGSRSSMVRFVVDPAGFIVPDIANKLPGRGAWVWADRKSLELAVARNQFPRALNKNARISAGLATDVEMLLAKRVVQLLSMARKAGLAIAGFEKVAEALNSGEIAILLQASDGSPRQKSRVCGRLSPEERIGCLSASEIGIAFGRNRVVHAALVAGRLTRRIADDARRLAGFRVEADPVIFEGEMRPRAIRG